MSKVNLTIIIITKLFKNKIKGTKEPLLILSNFSNIYSLKKYSILLNMVYWLTQTLASVYGVSLDFCILLAWENLAKIKYIKPS